MLNINSIIIILTVAILIIIFITSFIKGLQGKIVLFNSYTDLFLSFLIVTFPFLCYYIFFFMFQNKVVNIIFSIIELFLLIILFKLTHNSNKHNILTTICVLYSKLILSFIFVFYLIQILNNKMLKHRKINILDLLTSTLIVPLITKLVKN